jgi:sugar-specific transcriptional regulator TrmB
MDNNIIQQNLINIGLTRQEADLYIALYEEGAMTAKNVSKKLNILTNAVYRTAGKLQNKKLITIINKSPLTYQALAPELGLTIYSKARYVDIEQKTKNILNGLSKIKTVKEETKVELISGKNETYTRGAELANSAKEEFLVISIGEEIPEELLLAIRKAHQRGVTLKLIVHKFDEENRSILESFKKNGYEVRYYPDWGFHMTICDGESALLIVNNPENTKQRVGINFYNHGLVKALREYYYSIWEKGTIV